MGPRTRSQSQASKSRGEDSGFLNTRLNILEDKFEEIIDDIDKSNKLMEDRFKIMASVIKDEVENKIEINSKVSQEENTQFQPEDDIFKQDEEIKSDLREPSRLPNGDFNLQIPFHLPQARTAQEKRILEDWPEVVLPSQAHLYGATSHKNRVTFAPGTFLSFADSKVLPTLVQVQDQLKTALIPYHLWPMRLVSIMNEDFQQVATWAKRGSPTWLDLIEAIIQVLKKHQTLYSQMTQFARMAPKNDEDKLQFLR
ncbi:hypothetical protein EPUL_006141, partial [Erysiphe pulchra]